MPSFAVHRRRSPGYRSQVHKKGYRNRSLNKRAQESNHRKSRIRARIEHLFGSIEKEMGGLFIRVIGLARGETKIGLMNLVYNLKRCASLCRRCLSAA
ncbi:transposase [Nitrosococcus halophilus]|uniref:transposase n=1 Tax=Nitrosococcus halophilus TaxID=133539 RepID=UPI003B82DB27